MLPEDDANREVANGFLLHHSLKARNIQVLEVAGGWTEVLSRFKSDHVAAMDRFTERRMVLLIDFDGKLDRLGTAKAAIPNRLLPRVFILGALTEPEALKGDLGLFETIGMAMAEDCRDGTSITWGHALLEHNASELARLQHVLPILF